MKTTYHVGIAIDPALRMSDRKIDGILSDDSGRSMGAKEVRLFLQAERAKGYSVFCGCDNRKPDGCCAGHPTDEDQSNVVAL